MVKYRDHRGGANESTATRFEFETREDLVQYLATDLRRFGVDVSDSRVQIIPMVAMPDRRIVWNTHVVVVSTVGVVGYTDGNFPVVVHATLEDPEPTAEPDPLPDDPLAFVPGTLGCHEALHMASYFASAVDTELAEHPAITRNPEWKALADAAAEKLADLYQAIGTVHLNALGVD